MWIKGVVTSASDSHGATIYDTFPINQIPKHHIAFVILEPNFSLDEDIDGHFQQLEWVGRMIGRRTNVETIDELLDGFSLKQREFFWQSYGWFFGAHAIQRLGYGTESELPFSKGCMIGAGEANVRPDGTITVCDKAQSGDTFVIGRCHSGANGISMRSIDRLSAWLHNRPECTSCFAQRFCSLCFEKLDSRIQTALGQVATDSVSSCGRRCGSSSRTC